MKTSITWRCVLTHSSDALGLRYEVLEFEGDPKFSEVFQMVQRKHAQQYPNCPVSKAEIGSFDVSLVVRLIQ